MNFVSKSYSYEYEYDFDYLKTKLYPREHTSKVVEKELDVIR